MVPCENWCFSQILHFVFFSAAISKGQKWVRRSNIISIVNLDMVYQIPELNGKAIVCEYLSTTSLWVGTCLRNLWLVVY